MTGRNLYTLTNPEIIKAFEEYQEERQRVYNSWVNFAEKYGSDRIYAGSWLKGIELENPDPKLWSSPKDLPNGFYRPLRRKGNDAYHESRKLGSMPDWFEFGRKVGIDPVFHGQAMHLVTVEKLGDTYILSVHNQYNADQLPDGIKPIRLSAYYALKEEA